jgi:thymidylate synthase (FAD)
MKIVPMSCELLDSMGTDLSVVNAARVSFAKESTFDFSSSGDMDLGKLRSNDAKLISYLAKHKHWTPFAHCFASFRIKIPMFVAMQLDKHTVGLVTNSVSRRYVDDEPEYFLPDSWRSRPENGIKQGSGVYLSEDDQETAWFHFHRTMEQSSDSYQELLTSGVAPEMARMVLPMNTMTERIWSGSLAAFARVCNLRLDPHSQKEIQELAGMVKAQLEPLWPVSFGALMEN